jgi:glycosyltransferase involved in cell wall biosynthesis
MRVLVVAPHLPPTHVGGVEAYTKSVADQLTALGHGVEAAAVEEVTSGSEDGCDARTDVSNGYPIHRLRLALGRDRSFPLLWEHSAAETWFVGTIRRFGPDVVHVQSGYLLGAAALAAARRCGTPSVVTLHDYWFACPRINLLQPGGELCSGPEGVGKCAWCLKCDRRRYRVIPRVLRKRLAARTRESGQEGGLDRHSTAVAERLHGVLGALEGAAAVLAATRFVAERVANAGFPIARIRIDPFGLPRGPRVVRAPVAEGLRLAYLGQIAPHKGVHVAVEAVRANTHPALRLAIHGPRTPHAEYAARLERIGAGDSRITFHGAYRRDDQAAILAATDAIVVPSICYESAGLVIWEANDAGVPVVASRLGGIPELVTHDRDGLLFEPGQPDDLGRQIERLQSEPGLLARLAAETRPPRSIEDHVQGLVGLYKTISGRI